MNILFAVSLLASISGTAPWCVADDFGSLTCFYYDYSSCAQAAGNSNQACVPNPKNNR